MASPPSYLCFNLMSCEHFWLSLKMILVVCMSQLMYHMILLAEAISADETLTAKTVILDFQCMARLKSCGVLFGFNKTMTSHILDFSSKLHNCPAREF